MSRSILLAAAGGVLSGLLYLALVVGSMGGIIFAYLSQVPLFLVGLGLGVRPVLIAGAIATAIIAGAGNWLSALLLLLTNIGPVWILTRQALLNRPGAVQGQLEWYPPGLLLAWLTGMALVGIVGVPLFMLDSTEGVEGAIREGLTSALSVMLPPHQGGTADPAAIAAQIAPFFLGMIAASWMTMVVVNGSLAQGVLAGFGRSIRPSPAIVEVDLPRWCYAALLLSAVVAVAVGGAVGYIARNLTIALVVPFFFQGLGVFHALIARWTARTAAFVAFYIVLVVLVWPVVFVIAAGLAEPFARVRQRLSPPRK